MKLDNKDISIVTSSSDITYKLALAKQSEQASIGTFSKYLLNVIYDPNAAEGEIKEYIDVKLKKVRGRDATFRIKVSGQITPIIESIPSSIFLVSVDSTNAFEKKIQVINGKEESIKITGVLFPESIDGTYDVTGETVWKKGITFKMKFPIIEKSVGKFIITVIVSDKNLKIHKLKIPCLYIGEPNVKKQ